jgi:hypothetical protein
MANIARLGVALGLNSAEFVTGINAAGKKLDQFSVAAVGVAKNGIAALAAAFSVATYKAIGYADELADVAAANDIAIDSIIKLTNALETSGGKGDNAGKMISSFTDFVDKAAKGSFEGQKIFSELGISLKDIANLSTQQLLLKTANALASIEDPLTRNARAADAFGKAAKGVDMVEFAKGVKEGTGVTREQEQAIKDAAEAFDTFRSVGRDVAILIIESIGPSLKSLANYLKEATKETSFLSIAFGSAFKTIAHAASDVTFVIKGISAEVTHAIKNVQTLTTYLMTGQLSKGVDKIVKDNQEYIKQRLKERAELDAYQNKLLGNEPKVSGRGIGFDDPRIVTPEDEARRQVTPGVDTKALAAAKAAADKAAAEAKATQAKKFELEKARLEETFSITNQFLNEQQKLENEYAKKKAEADLERLQKDATEENKFTATNFNILNKKLYELKQEYEEKKKTLVFKNMAEQAAHEIASAEEAAIAIANLNAFYSEGNTSIREKQELDKTSLTRAQEMFKLERQAVYLKAEELQQEKELLEQQWKYADAVEAIMSMKNLDSMSRMEALAREEKLNEKALQNILERTRILKAEKSGGVFDGFLFRAQTFGKDMETSFEAGAKGFDSLMGSMTKALDEFVTTGKLNFGDFAKSVIKDMLAIQFRASANNLFSMLAKAVFSPSVSLAEPFGGPKADGGPVESNSSYLVGERGPELFVPRSAGAIVPNHSMAMMGGSTNITNYNIQAIDTKSFEDRILGSSKAVWAANAYGAKNLSLGRGRT